MAIAFITHVAELPTELRSHEAGDPRGGMVRRELLRYLQANPHACDTAQGIRTWWLPQVPDLDAMTVVDVLEEMVRKGLMQSIQVGGVVLYRAAPERDRTGG